ncbi:MAG: hypothetical protein L3J14_09140 [Flavobacteriaceae bacterium]|nr:hypothetical protein [Flavobacteriaceae bacterium]
MKPHNDVVCFYNPNNNMPVLVFFGIRWYSCKTIWTDGYGERFLIINPNENLTLAEQNFTGNSFLTTGLWLKNRNMDSGLGNLMKANLMITQKKAH